MSKPSLKKFAKNLYKKLSLGGLAHHHKDAILMLYRCTLMTWRAAQVALFFL
ncbi:hypothetical protein FDUTEX481_09664 [Tolypothrix sp. PCC 7601]|nr:hypothetical protein FDUTEX481_09664 [Tolypothrix sp. PCC 7601]